MSTFAQWLLLCRVHGRMMQAKTAAAASRSRLLLLTISGFLLGYMVAAYWLFRKGLGYVSAIPGAGGLLGDRLVHLLFLCFFLMLVFSVAVTAYISLYRGRDTAWLLSLPISHRALFLWKCFESATFSCWGLAFILAPFLVAFAGLREVEGTFFLKTLLIFVLFLILAGALGSLILISATRWLSRRQIIAFLIAIIIGLGASALRAGMEDRRVVQDTGLSAALTFQRVLHHTGIAANRAIPSTWVASSIVAWTRSYPPQRPWLYPTLLFSHALFFSVLLVHAGERWFYASWNRAHHQASGSRPRHQRAPAEERERLLRDYPRRHLPAQFIGRPLAAISRKDLLTFVREPSQWVQFALVFGLLALYASGLRKMNGNIEHPRDLYFVAFLNLAVCALALSTLTTRFVFPQFSLEGRRLWILAMSPLRLPRIVFQKFVTSTLGSGIVVVAILCIGGYNLRLGPADTLFFALAIALLAMGLNGLAVGLGVLFPNLREANAAKIVSGFGGTLCLVASFIYILSFILLLAWLRWDVFETNAVNPDWFRHRDKQFGLLILLALTGAVTWLPLFFSQKKLKGVEISINS